MSQVEIGQQVEVDLFGLKVSGSIPRNGCSIATVVGTGPGTITVRLELEGCFPTEVTVSYGRLRGALEVQTGDTGARLAGSGEKQGR